ncbi:MAG: epoxyqueuosine reductase [Clostridia bacterium]
MGKRLIEKIITENVFNNIYKTKYREPIIGYADAKDSQFTKLKEVGHPKHLLPTDLLNTAKTVIAYFIPFTKELVEENKKHNYVAPSWALAYVETNNLITDINNNIKKELAKEGIKVSTIKATHNFDKELIMSMWSHRHIAYIAGVGTFGVNNLLITEKGCAGRLGSFVIDQSLEPSDILNKELCLYKQDKSCVYCFDKCPVGAFDDEEFARSRCYDYLLEVVEHFKDIDPNCDVCGKCNCGPCAILSKGE